MATVSRIIPRDVDRCQDKPNDLLPDFEAAQRYLTSLDESADKFTFQCFIDAKAKKGNGKNPIIHGSLDQISGRLTKLINAGYGIFITINKTNLNGRKTGDIIHPRAVWIDDDIGQLTGPDGLEPHLIIQTSKGKRQLIYLIGDGETVDHGEWARVQQRLVVDYGSDPAAADIARVLRLPGFCHQKNPDNPQLVTILHESGQQPHAWQTIKQHIKPIEEHETKPPAEAGDGSKLAEIRSALAHLNPDCGYAEWLEVGMATHFSTNGGTLGLELWREWSRGDLSGSPCPKYPSHPQTIPYKWNSFSTDGKDSERITELTIYKRAYDAGWDGPGLEVIQDELKTAIDAGTLTSGNVAAQLAKRFYTHGLDNLDRAVILESVLAQLKLGKKKTALKDSISGEIIKLRQAQRKKGKTRSVAIMPLTCSLSGVDFPNVRITEEQTIILQTPDNLRYMMSVYGIQASYDVVLKQATLKFPGTQITGTDMDDERSIQMLRGACGLNQIPLTLVDFLPVILMENQCNPVLEWIESKKWDGVDRVRELADTVTVADESREFWPVALSTWLIQCVAALDGGQRTPRDDALQKYEGVLILAGDQGIKKTTFFNQLVPREFRRYILDGAHLDLSDKDSIKICISHWITELGEIDATFKKSDIAGLKAFLSKQRDNIRLPYARTESQFKRRTSFCASVNDVQFLVDKTGNRRYWPVSVTAIRQHGVDTQQLWAQVWYYFRRGSQWWPDESMEALLLAANAAHRESDPVDELLEQHFDLSRPNFGVFLIPGEIRDITGLQPGDLRAARQISNILRNQYGFQMIKIRGRVGFRITQRTKTGMW